MGMIGKLVKKVFKKLGYDIIPSDQFYLISNKNLTYSYDFLYTYHNCDFITDPRFAEAYRLGKATDADHSVLQNGEEIFWRVHVLCWAATHALKLDGDFVECGVNTGIFARAIIHYTDFNSTGKKYYLLDTFNGFDERYSTSEERTRMASHYSANKKDLYEQVQQTFKGFNVRIIQGPVPDTLPGVDTQKVSFLSIDMNSVRPEIEAMNFFWDKMVPGGIIILDDYGYANMFLEQKKAHDEFARSKGVEILTLPTCQGMIIKPGL